MARQTAAQKAAEAKASAEAAAAAASQTTTDEADETAAAETVVEPGAPAEKPKTHRKGSEPCEIDFPLGWDQVPEGVTAVGCEHGSWER